MNITLDEVAATLPNGFHDAFLRGLHVDHASRTAEMELEVWVGRIELGTYDPQNEAEYLLREAYRRGRLHFSSVVLFAADVPNQAFLDPEENGPDIGLFPTGYEPFSKQAWPDEPLPDGAFLGSFVFTNELNSFVHIAAQSVEWVWLSEPRTIY